MNTSVKNNTWDSLQKYTTARIALGRTGVSIPTNKNLLFQLDHAQAKDSVLDSFNTESIARSMLALTGVNPLILDSAAIDRKEYLMRPDLGRKLSDTSREKLSSLNISSFYDLSITISDGLSARAIHENSALFIKAFLPLVSNLSIAPITIASSGRVAIADEIGNILRSTVSIILIGERPGLKSPNSMGIYMTYGAKPGTTDERRNCISNIRPEGMGFESAASKLHYLLKESLKQKYSGVYLKDEQQTEALNSHSSCIRAING